MRKVNPLPGILKAGRSKLTMGKKRLKAWVVSKIFQMREGVDLGELRALHWVLLCEEMYLSKCAGMKYSGT